MNDKKSESTFAGRKFAGGPGLGVPMAKPKDFRNTAGRLLTYLRPHLLVIILVSLLALLSSVFGVISPRLLGLATTRIFEGYIDKSTGIDFSYVGKIVIYLIVIYLLSAVFTYIMQYVLAGLSQKIVFQIRKEMNEKLSRLPVSFYDRRSQGDILSRIVNDVDNMGNTLQQSIAQLITSIISIVGVLIMMLVISPLLSLAAIITIPLSIWGTKIIVSKSQGHYKKQQKSLGDLNGHIEEMYTGHRIIKAYGYEDKSLERFEVLNEELYGSGWKAQFLSGMIMPLMGFINNLGYVFIAVIGALMITQGKILIGDVQAFIQYTRQLSHPIVQAANISNIIQSTVASAERIFEFLDETEEKDETDLQNVSDCQGRIEFKDVSFAYDNNDYVIKDFSLHVEEGQTVAIVGPTGSGKTTVVNLLMKFYLI